MYHKPDPFVCHWRLLTLFFGSCQKVHWLQRYGCFKFRMVGIDMYEHVSLGISRYIQVLPVYIGIIGYMLVYAIHTYTYVYMQINAYTYEYIHYTCRYWHIACICMYLCVSVGIRMYYILYATICQYLQVLLGIAGICRFGSIHWFIKILLVCIGFIRTSRYQGI